MSSKRKIETTVQELAYREKHFHDIRVIKDRQAACTSCGNRLNIESNKIFSHPWMEILQCETCWNHFREIDAKFRNDKTEKYCYICGNGKKLYVCSNNECISAFCKNCIKRNVNLSLWDAEKEDWKCFTCNSKPFWELRAVCTAIMDSFPKKSKRRTTNKYEGRTLPSQVTRIEKTREVQKALQMLCDREDDDNLSDETSSFVATRTLQKETDSKDRRVKQDVCRAERRKILRVMDSSSESSSSVSESSSISYKRDKQVGNGRDRKAKYIRDDGRDSNICLAQKISKSNAKGKNASNRRISNDPDGVSSDKTCSNKTVERGKRAIDRNIRTERIEKDEMSKRNRVYSSDSEDDENDSASKECTTSVSASLPKERNKEKNVESYDIKKTNKRRDSISDESVGDEDVGCRNENRKRRSTSRSGNDEQKYGRRDKSPKGQLPDMRQDDSDNSSGKEFQKVKLQKVHRVEYPRARRQFADLEMDYTKSLDVENSDKIEKDIDGRSDLNFSSVKKILSECKKICSNFQMYIDTMEQLYDKRDKEQLILKSTERIGKLKFASVNSMLGDLTTFYRSCSKSRKSCVPKRSRKVVSNDERSSSEETSVREERALGEDKLCALNSGNGEQTGSKDVSECDSEEIFSADETRSPQKNPQTIGDKVRDISKDESNPNDNDTKITDRDKTLIDESKDGDKDNVNSQDNLVSSPVLSSSKEKRIIVERPIKKQPFPECVKNDNSETRLKDKSPKDPKGKQVKSNSDTCDNETQNKDCEDYSLRNDDKKIILQSDKGDANTNEKDIIDESVDMFDTSLEDAEENGTKIRKTNVKEDEVRPLQSTIEYNLDTCDTLLQDKVPSERDKTSSPLFHNNGKENNNRRVDRNDRANVASVTNKEATCSEEIDTSEKTYVDDVESLDDAEALAKKILLESDSDTSNNTLSDANVTKQTEDLIKDTTCRVGKKNGTENDNSDINSISTITLSIFTKEQNATGKSDTNAVTKKNEVGDKEEGSDEELDGSRKEITSPVEEVVAKRALLESSSDESTILSSLNSEKITNDTIDSNSSKENAKARQALLASSNSECSSSEIETKVARSSNNSNKRNRDLKSDEDSLTVRMKKKRINLNRNYHYRNDKKLRMSCQVYLVRLSKKVLKRFSHALQESTEYLEHKALKSLINLDKLEKKRKKNAKRDSDSSTDNDASSKISKNSYKRKGKQIISKGESLMDHLKRIENGDVSATIEMDNSSSGESSHRVKRLDTMPVSNEVLIIEANKIAKEHLLNSSDSNDNDAIRDSDDSVNNDDENEKTENTKKKTDEKKPEGKTSKQDDSKKEKNDKNNWRRDKILTMKFSDTDSDAEKEKWDKKQEKMAKKSGDNNDSDDEDKCLEAKKKKKKKTRRRILDSDSDIKITDCSSDSDNSSEVQSTKQNSSDMDNTRIKKEKLKRKKRRGGDSNSSGTDSSFAAKKTKPKRKRIKKMASDSDSSNAEMKNSQGSAGKSGRKNIRKVLKDKQVAEDTKLAAKEEEERLKRIAERQALYNEMYEMRLAGEEKVEKLVLDFDTETKEELVSVHEELVKRLKPHQAQGIKFMWDASFESLERVQTTSGSGCIIAHCMGLGKTLQVIALTHTLLTHEATNVKTVLIVCPLSTVLNWLNEYNTWLKDLDDIEVYEMTKFKKNFERKCQLQRWQKTGGVMIIGYEMFRNLTGTNRNIRKGMKEVILECLVDPGADLIVCDEGHLLKNEDTALSKCMRGVKTLRRIVLTGTPLQNNLTEYHCMVQFVKPNLLGTKKEFLNRFVNPITNGQFDDSTAYDVKLMKKRAHVLHKMLEGSVQRFDYSVLTPFLPPKQEYVIFVRLEDTQIKMYQYYLDNLARRHSGSGGALFADFQALQRIWTHPIVLRLNAEKIEKANEKKGLSSESEGSLIDFINDDTTDPESSSCRSSDSSNSDSDVQAIDDVKENATAATKRKTRNNPGEEEPEEEAKEEKPEAEWWSQFVQPEHFQDMRVSAKLLLLFGILKESEQIGDKVLVFSQSLYSLTLIEEFLRKIDDQTQNDTPLDTLDNHTGSWSLGLDYFRLDGQTSAENRSAWCKIFNKPTNTRARLFLISTRAGGLGINLTAANRVIIFDASWNPSHDVQSIFRIYRFGQKKPCYVYRFLAAGTMEEKIYNRQVTKLSLSCRVVDEQQIERHYSNHNLNELYRFEGYDDKEKATLNLPKDRLLAEIFLKYKDFVENYHEHDSLLENKAEEELDEEERKQAWLEYEEEKKGKPLMNPMWSAAYQNNIMLQQYNMMINSGQPGMVPQDMSLQHEYENLQQLIRKDYPNATPEQQKMMTNRALVDMYNYWEKQATLFTKQPLRNPSLPMNFQQKPIIVPYSTTGNNNTQQVSQLNQLLTSGQSGNYVNVNKSVQPSGPQRGVDLLPNLFTYRNFQLANDKGDKTDHDIIEMVPTTSKAGVSNTQLAVQPADNSKNQEE